MNNTFHGIFSGLHGLLLNSIICLHIVTHPRAQRCCFKCKIISSSTSRHPYILSNYKYLAFISSDSNSRPAHPVFQRLDGLDSQSCCAKPSKEHFPLLIFNTDGCFKATVSTSIKKHKDRYPLQFYSSISALCSDR